MWKAGISDSLSCCMVVQGELPALEALCLRGAWFCVEGREEDSP
jgi:hypothetical protein